MHWGRTDFFKQKSKQHCINFCYYNSFFNQAAAAELLVTQEVKVKSFEEIMAEKRQRASQENIKVQKSKEVPDQEEKRPNNVLRKSQQTNPLKPVRGKCVNNNNYFARAKTMPGCFFTIILVRCVNVPLVCRHLSYRYSLLVPLNTVYY